MEITNTSSLKHYSLGIVIQDKVEGSDIIKVDPIESFTLDQGKITEDSRKYDSQLKDHKGVEKKQKLVGGSVVEAKWIAYGYSNRESAPDVYKNETVILYRFANDPRIYWTTIFREPMIRRLETVVYAYSNQPSGLVEYDADTSYWEKWDTRRKVIHRHTSDNDGEPFKYDIITNAKEGWHLITDDVGNYLRIDSSKTTNTLINAAGTYVVEEKDRLYGYAPTYICLSSPTIYLNTPNLVVGAGGCGTSVTGTDYHDRPFIRLNDGTASDSDGWKPPTPPMGRMSAMSRSFGTSPDGIGRENLDGSHQGAGDQEYPPYARIGNAYESYSHYDLKYRYSYSKDFITEETPLYTNNSNVHRTRTGLKKVDAETIDIDTVVYNLCSTTSVDITSEVIQLNCIDPELPNPRYSCECETDACEEHRSSTIVKIYIDERTDPCEPGDCSRRGVVEITGRLECDEIVLGSGKLSEIVSGMATTIEQLTARIAELESRP